MARWRNTPRAPLAWTIVLALILLALVAARSIAAPVTEVDAARYADAISGAGAGEARGPAHVGSADAPEDPGDVDEDPDATSSALAGEEPSDLDLDGLVASLALSTVTLGDPAELRDPSLGPRRPSPWGRLELSVAWRRAWRGSAAAATSAAAVIDDALLVFATWRR